MVTSTMRSIRGRGKLSFGQARLTSVKSMQSRHFLFAFLMRTNLASQLGVIHLPDSSCLEKFDDLFVDRFLPLWGEASSLLFDMFEGGTDI